MATTTSTGTASTRALSTNALTTKAVGLTDNSARLVLGLGGTIDYEIGWDSAVLEGLVAEHGIIAAELTIDRPIITERDLVVTVLAFLRDGLGGERFVASSDIVEAFAARFNTAVTLGGTCVRAAIAMRVLGITCTLHLVSIDDDVRRLLPSGCAIICSATQDTTDPHLIVQFSAGTKVHVGDIDIVSPHPNRIIYANDPPNRELVLSDDLGPALRRADIFMVAGFNVIQDVEVLEARLARIRADIAELPSHALVVYEDSGFHVPGFNLRVRDQIVDIVDVFSMNEDEMQMYVGREVDLLDATDVRRALDELHAIIPARTTTLHTKYWSLAHGALASQLRSALIGGITMASTRYLHGDGFTAQHYVEVGQRPVHPGGVRVGHTLEAAGDIDLVCVPAFVLDTDRPTTVGLGDTFVGGFIAALAEMEGMNSDRA